MEDRRKALFWGAALAAAAVVCVPSTLLLHGLASYRRFVGGFDPQAVRPTRPRAVFHRERRDAETRLEFVEFRLRAPKAKEVGLVGDFNGWKPGTLALARENNGAWELLLPLPRGRHRYQFLVDGEPQTDPANPDSTEADGRRVSVKEVK